MTTLFNLVRAPEGPIAELFADAPQAEVFDIKKDQLSVHLAALMVHSNCTRTELSEKLGWKKSQITRLLSGKANPTAKTIFEFSSTLGYDFDVVFRSHSEERAQQPWEKSSEPAVADVVYRNAKSAAVFKSRAQVAMEIASGTGHAYYVGLPLTNDMGDRTAIDVESKLISASSSSPWFSQSKSLNIADTVQTTHYLPLEL